MSTTDKQAAPVEAAPEGSFGAKPSTDDVALMQSVMSRVGLSRPATPAPDTQKQEAAPAPAEAATEPKPDAPQPPADEAAAATTPEATPAVATEEEDRDDTDKHEDSKAWPASAIKRTDKLRAQKKELEAEKKELTDRIAALEAKAEQAPAQPDPDQAPIDTPAPAGMAHFDTLEAVAAHREKLESDLDWLDAHRHAGFKSDEVDEYGEPKIAFTPEQVNSEYLAYKAKLRDLPKIEKALEARDTKYRPLIAERYDWWSDKSDPRYQQVQATLRQFPELRRAANHELLLANAAEMEHRWNEKTAAKGTKPAAKVTKPAAPIEDAPPPVPATGKHAAPTQPRVAATRMSQSDLAQARSGSRSGTVNLVRSLLSQR